MQGPEPYLADFNIALRCAVDSTVAAILDAEHRFFVNHEVYYVSTPETHERFKAEPWRFTGRLTDPVSLVRFQPEASSPLRVAAGRRFYFESSETVAQFDQDPARYSTPKPTMQEVK